MSSKQRSILNRTLMFVPALLFCLLVPGLSQTPAHGASQATSPSAPNQYPGKVRVDFYMTPQEAARLLGAVDEIIAFDSKLTGLAVRSRVERRITDRNQLKQLADKRLTDDDVAQRIQRSSLVLRKFGFIPRDFDLQKFAVELTVDELAGYYDPHVKTMYLLDWLPAKMQQPVMAHELDHALQDQNFGLEKWMKVQDAAGQNLSHAELEEQQAARRAVAEGHATAVMIDYILAPYGKSLAQLPAVPADVIQKTFDRRINSPAMQYAPLLLREAAIFPYVYGFEFIHQVLLTAGKERAYSGVFKNPPRNTRQIMEPGTYLSGEKLPPLKIPALEAVLGSDYQKLDDGVMGEFDTMVFLKQFGSAEQARRVTPQWRGGYYYAAHRLGKSDDKQADAKPADSSDPHVPIKLGDVALLYVSRWATPAAAHDFAEVYRASLPRRYPGAQSLITVGQPTANEELAHWNTSDGCIPLEVKGDQVVAVESFDQGTASNLVSILP
jgi:hypothetical protein